MTGRAGYLGAGSKVERRHFLGVAHEQNAAGQRGHVPGFAVDGRHAGDFLKLLGSGGDERELTLLGR